MFGGSSDTLLTNIRNGLQSETSGPDFPISDINKVIEKSGKMPYFEDNAIANYLSNQYGEQLTFLALSILYQDYNWGAVKSPKHMHQTVFDEIFSSLNKIMKPLNFP